MSGTGERFKKVGYKDPKPLIEVESKPIIQHVVERFSKEDEFIFICNADHIQATNMKSILEKIAPNNKILTIDPHKKGPVYAVSKVYDSIDDNKPSIVNYCDFSWRWDYSHFKRVVSENDCAGSVISYKGFHPHLLHPNLYASMKENSPSWMEEIKEKHTYTENKMDCYQSSGTYYFRSGSIIKKYFTKLMESGLELNGEFYVSLVYNELAKDKLPIYIYEIPFMLQWGTPEDLEEYNYWSRYFLN